MLACALQAEFRTNDPRYPDGQWFYFLHYSGWNKKFDEWVEAPGLVRPGTVPGIVPGAPAVATTATAATADAGPVRTRRGLQSQRVLVHVWVSKHATGVHVCTLLPLARGIRYAAGGRACHAENAAPGTQLRQGCVPCGTFAADGRTGRVPRHASHGHMCPPPPGVFQGAPGGPRGQPRKLLKDRFQKKRPLGPELAAAGGGAAGVAGPGAAGELPGGTAGAGVVGGAGLLPDLGITPNIKKVGHWQEERWPACCSCCTNRMPSVACLY